MKTLPIQGRDGPAAPLIHLEFIRGVVESGDPAGAESVDAFHRSLFLHQHGEELARQEQERRGAEERVAVLEGQLRQANLQLADQQKFVPPQPHGTSETQPNPPWNFWSRLMFISAGLSILCLVVFGVFNISFNLLESGIVTFSEHPVRAYFWAALLPVGALAVKIGWDLLEGRQGRHAYAWGCLLLGLLGGVAWLAAYASIYPNLSKTTEEQILSLNVFDNAAATGAAHTGAKTVDRILVTGQAVAEIFLSAVLGIYMSLLYARHRPVQLVPNPTFEPFDREREGLELRLQRQRGELAQAQGALTRLDNELNVFVAYARSLFLREQAGLRDRGFQQRRIIEEAAHDLRLRLAALDGPDRSGTGKGELQTQASNGDHRP